MDEQMKATFSQLMYAMTKECARSSWMDFLENWGIDDDDYEELKVYLKQQYDIKTYV